MIVGSAHSRADFARERAEAVIMRVRRAFGGAARQQGRPVGLPAKRAFHGRPRTMRGATEGRRPEGPAKGGLDGARRR
jgi:hypothetical protein